MPEPQRLDFAPFLLDLRDERRWQKNEPIRLGSNAFALLRCLLTHAGQLVTKDTFLLPMVWPETAVNEAVLTLAMAELRRALGDQPHRPQFIETAHGRGYRFIAPVAGGTDAQDAWRSRHGI
jgi:DNA-binding winged helix-turn-helix (wHTH) protein